MFQESKSLITSDRSVSNVKKLFDSNDLQVSGCVVYSFCGMLMNLFLNDMGQVL